MIQSKSAGHAKTYFSDALSKADYYASDQELPGFWQGRLAARLGLSGRTERDDFFALCENLHPRTGESLTPRTKEERTVGYDINFHCPKSVSILHMLAVDDHVLEAFRDSVTETMQVIEADAMTRVRLEGRYEDRHTGSLVWGHFIHQTARPVDGFLPDPHLHSHCFVFNATRDDEEKRIKAAQFREIKRDMPFYQSRFHKTFADKLAALGYGIRRTARSFEIEGVPKKAIALFSKRTDEIGRAAKQKGITDPAALAELGARTRGKKQKGLGMADLKTEWRRQIAGLDLEQAERDMVLRHAGRHAGRQDRPQLTARQCLDHALLHGFERASVMDGRRILKAAYHHAIGSETVGIGALDDLFGRDKRIIRVQDQGRSKCTTREVLIEEKRMVDLARQGQGKMKPLYSTAPQLVLKGQLAAAVEHVLTTTNRVAIIRGAAGSGKTTLMQTAIPMIEAAGKKVTVLAPSSSASRGTLKEAGFKEADTVAALLQNSQRQQELKGQVIWVDEAGLLGTKDMLRLLEIATERNARLILGGDTRQHASVRRGDALRILNTVAGIKTAEVSKIYRQTRENYREAVQDLADGKIKTAFGKLDDMGAVREVEPGKAADRLVEDYMTALAGGKAALVVSPTHEQAGEVTEKIRETMRGAGMIGKKELTVQRLKNLQLTEAERSDPRRFSEGQYVQFSQNATGFRRGSLWRVEAADGETVTVKNNEGEIKSLPLDKSRRYEIYEAMQTTIAKGDRIRITRNGFDENGRRLNNGDLLTVQNVSKAAGQIALRNEISKESYMLGGDYGHLAHAHCITSFAAQGKNVDVVLIYQPAATFPATSAKQFYVSVSRGREAVTIYTDDKAQLLEYAERTGDREAALELIGKDDRTKEILRDIQQEIDRQRELAEQEKSKQRRNYEPER